MHISLERGHVNLISIPGLAGYMHELTYKIIPISLTHSEVLNIFFNGWDSVEEITLSTFFHSSWKMGAFQPDIYTRASWLQKLTYI